MKFRVLILALVGIATAGAEDHFLPVEQVFRYLVESDGHCLTVRWNVAPGYYLYKSRMGVESGTPGITLGKPRYPKGEIHEDEYFGAQEVFRDDVTVEAPITRSAGAPSKLSVKLKLQGCADAGLCYPPTVWQTEVELPPAKKRL